MWRLGRVPKHLPAGLRDAFLISAMVLHCHLDKTYSGAMAASLSIPWGNSTDSLGGYHIVWPRDLVESAGALLALQAWEEARHVLRYLIATQYEDGHWAQNQWLGGQLYWTGIQLDEVGFPVLLAAALAEANALQGIRVEDMVRRALTFIANQGPSSQQDRITQAPTLVPDEAMEAVIADKAYDADHFVALLNENDINKTNTTGASPRASRKLLAIT